MSETHLKDLRNGIERSHWVIATELEGNDYDISGIWVIEKPDKSQKLHLEFDGLDDMETLPVNKCYGCKVREYPEISAYFSRENRSWPEELSNFLVKLSALNT